MKTKLLNNLPSHVPVFIDPSDIESLREYLIEEQYYTTFFQILKPGQIMGLVKEVDFNGMRVEHHIRCFTTGMITTEIELRRVKDVWLHLTSHSISAHEKIIEVLDELSIPFTIDEKLRTRYAENGPDHFRRDMMELFRWFFYGVVFWTPLGTLWSLYYKVRQKLTNGK